MGFFFKKKEKQEQDTKRKENQIGLETKHDTNTKTNTECTDYIKRCCQELEEAGYGSLKIQEFMREVENYQDVEKIEMAKNVRIRNIERDRKILEERIRRIERGDYADQEKVYEIAKLEQSYKDKWGHPIDIEERKNKAIKELEEAGYGSFQIEFFRNELEKQIEKQGAPEINASNIATFTSKKLEEIKEVRELTQERKKRKLNPQNVTQEQKLYQMVYGEEGEQGLDYIKKMKQNDVDLLEIGFDLTCGHEKFSEYSQKLAQKLKLYGVGNDECETFLERANALSKEDMDFGRKVNALVTIAKPFISKKREDIVLYTSKEADNLISEGAASLGMTDKKAFIRLLLSSSEENLPKLYDRVDQSRGYSSKFTFGNRMETIKRSLQRKKEIHAMDLLNNSLNSGVSKTDVTEAKRYEDKLRNPEQEKGRLNK